MWNKQPKSEVLINVNDVAQGHITKQRWNDPDKWVWSGKTVHEPLIDDETFKQAHPPMWSASERSESTG
ncbi:MAG: recombinase [Actinomycetia bacterium]|nr:recombinase [Actinomycetes bacterium]